MKHIPGLFLILLLLAFSLTAYSNQDTLTKPADDKKVIRMLLKERKDRFAQYTEHLDDRSGIFGNQTKKDIKQVNEVLKEIIRTDNKIIIELDRLLDQRRFETYRSEFETRRSGQELVDLQMQNEKLVTANDTLMKQLQVCRETSTGTSGSRSIYIFFTYLFGAILLFMLLLRLRKHRVKD